MIPTPNLIQGELHAIDKKRLPGSHRYNKQFYPPKFIKKLERHLIKRYPNLKILAYYVTSIILIRRTNKWDS